MEQGSSCVLTYVSPGHIGHSRIVPVGTKRLKKIWKISR